MALSAKHSAFVNAYLTTFNATEAYHQVYAPKSREVAASSGHRLFRNDEIAEAISQRLSETAMGADEVLMRLAEHARGDIADFLQVSPNGDAALTLTGENEKARTRLIKKVTQRKTIRTTEQSQTEEVVLSVELHDAQAALVQIGKHHKLFVDRTEVTGKDGKDLSMQTVTHIYLPDNGRNDSNTRTDRDQAASGAAGDGAGIVG